MGKIIVWNSHGNEDYSQEPTNHYIGRSKTFNPLGNPFTHNGVKSNLAKLSFKTREEAIEAYKQYFNQLYGNDERITKAFDEIYEEYKSGKDVYLQCFCKPLPCHGDYLAEMLQKKLLKEIFEERRKAKRKDSQTEP